MPVDGCDNFLVVDDHVLDQVIGEIDHLRGIVHFLQFAEFGQDTRIQVQQLIFAELCFEFGEIQRVKRLGRQFAGLTP